MLFARGADDADPKRAAHIQSGIRGNEGSAVAQLGRVFRSVAVGAGPDVDSTGQGVALLVGPGPGRP